MMPQPGQVCDPAWLLESADVTAIAAPKVPTVAMADQFADRGYFGPRRVLAKQDCQRFLRAVDFRSPAPLDWSKGRAATSRAYYEVAALPAILDVVSELLGGEVILWGASIQSRMANEVHPWHSDIESSDPDCRTVSVWVGLENTTPESSLLAISRSHLFGVTVQQVLKENGTARDESSLDDLVRWAHERDSRTELVTLGATDGEALFFDGRLWHGTHNVSQQARRALLLQYAAPDTVVQVPDLNYLDWPFRPLDSPRPPCLMMRGSAKEGVNRLVPAPIADGLLSQGVELRSRIYPLRLPLESAEGANWKPYPAFSGSTADLPLLSCHASVLLPGHSPHPLHAHPEEELLLLLSGEIDLELEGDERIRLRPGELVYYPSGLRHTIHALGVEAAMYVMFKWRGEESSATELSPFQHCATTDGSGELFERAAGYVQRVLFEGATAYLRTFHAHVTDLAPDHGYDPHVDAYDVAIVVLDGEVETLGGRAKPNDVIFYRAGEAHGMQNPGPSVARYIVFEFHGRTSLASDAPSSRLLLAEKLTDPERWKRKLRAFLRR
jgi:quercetin dioxygenase-like cupin family protein